MGEAKRRGKLRERVLEKTPFCIYFGVTTPATQVDHMPPRTMFDLRDRSEGLEFGACSECNQGSRHFELAASMLSRIYPDPTTEQGKEEVAKLFKTVKNRWPELLVEMQPDGRQLARFEAARSKLPGTAHVLSAKGPLLNNALRHFSAKLGIALHCDRTGKVLPEAGVIAG